MRLATIKLHGAEVAGIVTGKGILPVAALNAYKGTGWKEDMMSLIQAGHIPGLTKWYNEGGKEELETIPGVVPAEEVVYAPLYRNPKRIFGIGLNYADHAKDIGNAAPTGFPGSFFKMADTLIGPNDDILLPKLKEAQKTTAEAELGIIMGRDCRDVPEEEWESAIVGYTTILDMTEESILKGNDFVPGNPRYLTIVKNFPTFFSFGPQLVTPDEVPDVLKLRGPERPQRRDPREEHRRSHDARSVPPRFPALEHPGLVRRRRALHRHPARVPHSGRRHRRVPYRRPRRL